MTEFVALRSKVYAFRNKDEEVTKAGGVPEEARKNQLSVEKYLECLRSGQVGEQLRSMQLQSRDHVLRDVEVEMKGLSPLDDKRWVREDGLRTYAYGHWRISHSIS